MSVKTIIIRQEVLDDYPSVFNLIAAAFENDPSSDQSEPFLVDRLRKSQAFIPELSLVAEVGSILVGHILLTRVKIIGEQNEFESLALAPMSVLPAYQKMGIGSKLIKHAHSKARDLGYKSIVLIGHETYYPKFGYRLAQNFNIRFPFDAPFENCMVLELVEHGLQHVHGIVEYPSEFME